MTGVNRRGTYVASEYPHGGIEACEGAKGRRGRGREEK